MSEISFLPREHKIHIFEPTCNFLIIIWRQDVVAYNKRHEKPSSFNKAEKARSVTSMSDMTLASLSYGKYATRVPDGVAYRF